MHSPPTEPYDLVVIGGGAAGFFGAIQAATVQPRMRIAILEKSAKLLSKVKISGGGRCNVTYHCFEPTPLSRHYPRGQSVLKKLFRKFQAKDTVAWFEQHGVRLKAEADGRMFPVTDDSQTIIDCFLHLAGQYHINIVRHCGAELITSSGKLLQIDTTDNTSLLAKKVLVAIGGHPHPEAFRCLRKTGHRLIPSIPSLFTFNDSKKGFSDLMGVSVGDASVRIAGSRFLQQGPVLITHWGLSGPAVIKLSAWAAEYLHDLHYEFTALVNWIGISTEEATRSQLSSQRELHGKKKIRINPLFGLPQRLWERLVMMSGIEENKNWHDASNKEINRLLELLIRCPFQIKGKTTFKEEFVSCGGVDLKEINQDTMESKLVPGLYFAGEVLNVDGETGGFNFQAAWTTAFVAAQAIARQ